MEFILIFIIVCYAVIAFQFGHKVALKRIPIILVCLALGIGLVALARLVPRQWQDYVLPGFYIIVSLLLWVYIAVFYRQAKQAGRILLEIGRPRGGIVIGIIGTACAVFAGSGLIIQSLASGEVEISQHVSNISFGLFFFTLGAHIFTIWLLNWSIRERGIVAYGRIIKWAKIEGFHWDTARENTLVLKVKRFLPLSLWWSTYVTVPDDKKDTLTEILNSNINNNP
jgi:hypothetical protein